MYSKAAAGFDGYTVHATNPASAGSLLLLEAVAEATWQDESCPPTKSSLFCLGNFDTPPALVTRIKWHRQPEAHREGPDPPAHRIRSGRNAADSHGSDKARAGRRSTEYRVNRAVAKVGLCVVHSGGRPPVCSPWNGSTFGAVDWPVPSPTTTSSSSAETSFLARCERPLCLPRPHFSDA
jgi:hypothetical protein